MAAVGKVPIGYRIITAFRKAYSAQNKIGAAQNELAMLRSSILVDSKPQITGKLTMAMEQRRGASGVSDGAADLAGPLPALRCQRCGVAHCEMFICPTCKALQPVKEDLDYFAMFDFPRKFDIDLQGLSARYRRIQSVLHPDKHASVGEEEKLLAEAQSALVNKAYDTLLKPISRGVYILSLYGIHIEEAGLPNDAQFLTDVMTANEELSDCNDATSLAQLRRNNQAVADNFCKLAGQALDEGRLQEAIVLLSKLRYYISVLEKAKEKEMSIISRS